VLRRGSPTVGNGGLSVYWEKVDENVGNEWGWFTVCSFDSSKGGQVLQFGRGSKRGPQVSGTKQKGHVSGGWPLNTDCGMGLEKLKLLIK